MGNNSNVVSGSISNMSAVHTNNTIHNTIMDNVNSTLLPKNVPDNDDTKFNTNNNVPSTTTTTASNISNTNNTNNKSSNNATISISNNASTISTNPKSTNTSSRTPKSKNNKTIFPKTTTTTTIPKKKKPPQILPPRAEPIPIPHPLALKAFKPRAPSTVAARAATAAKNRNDDGKNYNTSNNSNVVSGSIY